MRRAPALAVALALGAAPPLAAQVVTLRLGGFRATYADSLTGTAASAGAEASWSAARASGNLGLSLASFSQGWAAQGYASAARFLSASPHHLLSLNVDAAGYGFQGGGWAGTAAGGPSIVADLGPLVASATVTAGGVHRLDGTSDFLATGTVRFARYTGLWSVECWGAGAAAGAVHYGDVGAGLRAQWSGASLDAAGGGRFGSLGSEGWAQVHAAVHLAGAFWLEAGAGRYPRDVTGFLHGTFAQAGLKVTLGRLTGAAAEADLMVRRDRGNAVTARFAMADTGQMSIAGEWNQWRAEPLEPAGRGAWLLRARLAPGVYRFSLVNGDGRWIVPPGVATVSDDFGGTVGLLVVPQ